MEKALARVKKKVQIKHYQIFDLVHHKGRSMKESAPAFGVTVPTVYLIKYRVKKVLEKELEKLRNEQNASGGND